MGPLPKRKISRTRRNKRRTHDTLSRQHLVVCETCGEYHLSHRVCMHCGSYRGETVIEIDEE